MIKKVTSAIQIEPLERLRELDIIDQKRKDREEEFRWLDRGEVTWSNLPCEVNALIPKQLFQDLQHLSIGGCGCKSECDCRSECSCKSECSCRADCGTFCGLDHINP